MTAEETDVKQEAAIYKQVIAYMENRPVENIPDKLKICLNEMIDDKHRSTLQQDFFKRFSAYYKRTHITGWVDLRSVLGENFSDFIREDGTFKFSMGEARFRRAFRMPQERYPDLEKFGWFSDPCWFVVVVKHRGSERRFITRSVVNVSSQQIGEYQMSFKRYSRIWRWIDVSQLKKRK